MNAQGHAILRLLNEDEETALLVKQKLEEVSTLETVRSLRSEATGCAARHLDDVIEPRETRAPFAEDVALSDIATSASSDVDTDRDQVTHEPVHAEAHVAAGPSGLGEIVESHPPMEVPRAPGQVVEGNKSAFETWIRQLGGKE